MADILIEAIVESEDVKKTLFLELDRIAKTSAILASNTSSISITRLASATSRPCQVILRICLLFLANAKDIYYQQLHRSKMKFFNFRLCIMRWFSQGRILT